MQFNRSGLDSMIEARINELVDKLTELRAKRFTSLAEAVTQERKRLLELGGKSKTLRQKVNSLCSQILNITLNPTEGSAAVIIAILNNLYAKKKALDDVFVAVKKRHAEAESSFNKFQYVLSQILYGDSTPDLEADVENLLADLRKHVFIFNVILWKTLRKCFQFAFTVEVTLKKIKLVLKHA